MVGEGTVPDRVQYFVRVDGGWVISPLDGIHNAVHPVYPFQTKKDSFFKLVNGTYFPKNNW